MAHQRPRPTEGGTQGGALAALATSKRAAGAPASASRQKGRADAAGAEMGRVDRCSRQSAQRGGGGSARMIGKRDRRARRKRAAANGYQRAVRCAAPRKEQPLRAPLNTAGATGSEGGFQLRVFRREPLFA